MNTPLPPVSPISIGKPSGAIACRVMFYALYEMSRPCVDPKISQENRNYCELILHVSDSYIDSVQREDLRRYAKLWKLDDLSFVQNANTLIDSPSLSSGRLQDALTHFSKLTTEEIKEFLEVAAQGRSTATKAVLETAAMLQEIRVHSGLQGVEGVIKDILEKASRLMPKT